MFYRWIRTDAVTRNRSAPPASPNVSRTPRPEEVTQGVAADPGEYFTVDFATPQGGGVTVSLSDGADVVVRSIGGIARFTSDVNRISVDAAAGTERFEIEIPRRAPRVEIRVGVAARSSRTGRAS